MIFLQKKGVEILVYEYYQNVTSMKSFEWYNTENINGSVNCTTRESEGQTIPNCNNLKFT